MNQQSIYERLNLIRQKYGGVPIVNKKSFIATQSYLYTKNSYCSTGNYAEEIKKDLFNKKSVENYLKQREDHINKRKLYVKSANIEERTTSPQKIKYCQRDIFNSRELRYSKQNQNDSNKQAPIKQDTENHKYIRLQNLEINQGIDHQILIKERINVLDSQIQAKERMLKQRILSNSKRTIQSGSLNQRVTSKQQKYSSLDKQINTSALSSSSKYTSIISNKENYFADIAWKRYNQPTQMTKQKLNRQIILKDNFDHKYLQEKIRNMNLDMPVPKKQSHLLSNKFELEENKYKQEANSWRMNNLNNIQQRIQSILKSKLN